MVTAVPVLMLLMSAAMKFAQPPAFKEGFAKFGYSEALAAPIGVVELVCTVVYLIPRARILGAILLTGYLGGATATHVRIGDAFFGPVLLGVLVWVGLAMRDEGLRRLMLSADPR